MRKLFDLIGMDVLSPLDANRFGSIFDVVLTKNGLLEIKGFIVDSDGNNSKFVYVPWYTVRFGENAAICSHYRPIDFSGKEFSEDKRIDGFFRSKDLINKRIYTKEGKEIGLLKDMYISETDGLVDGVQCSDGLVNDIINGRTIYPLIGKFELSEDRVILSKESIEESISRGNVPLSV